MVCIETTELIAIGGGKYNLVYIGTTRLIAIEGGECWGGDVRLLIGR